MTQARLLAPRLDARSLSRLEPGDADALRAYASLEGFAFSSIDAAGRDLVGLEVRESSILDFHAHEAARLKNVDLRGLDFRGISGFDGLHGTTLTTAQVLDLAPLFAEHFGVLRD